MQEHIDREIFTNETSEGDVLEYLMEPHAKLTRKYEELSKNSWKNVESKYADQH